MGPRPTPGNFSLCDSTAAVFPDGVPLRGSVSPADANPPTPPTLGAAFRKVFSAVSGRNQTPPAAGVGAAVVSPATGPRGDGCASPWAWGAVGRTPPSHAELQ